MRNQEKQHRKLARPQGTWVSTAVRQPTRAGTYDVRFENGWGPIYGLSFTRALGWRPVLSFLATPKGPVAEWLELPGEKPLPAMV